MHTQPFRFALALLIFFCVAGTALAAAATLVFGLITWVAAGALVVSALLVAAALKLNDAWREARWDAGQRLQ